MKGGMDTPQDHRLKWWRMITLILENAVPWNAFRPLIAITGQWVQVVQRAFSDRPSIEFTDVRYSSRWQSVAVFLNESFGLPFKLDAFNRSWINAWSLWSSELKRSSFALDLSLNLETRSGNFIEERKSRTQVSMQSRWEMTVLNSRTKSTMSLQLRQFPIPRLQVHLALSWSVSPLNLPAKSCRSRWTV